MPIETETDREPDSLPQPPLFHSGEVVATPGALGGCPMEYLFECLVRHLGGDWGHVCPEDAQSNDAALEHGSRILSAYPIDPGKPCYGNNCLWIITEWDRSVTTFLLPDEY